MAGIFDEVMEGINAKDPKATTEETQTAPAPTQEQTGDKPMNTYSNDFVEKYGEKKADNKKTA